MGRSIHRNGDRYREWSSICDQYVTPPMTRAEMAEHLAETTDSRRDATPARIEERLARADAQGTSAHDDTRDATTWDTERCDHCATFHHAFAPGPLNDPERCADCGATEGYIAHHPPCAAPLVRVTIAPAYGATADPAASVLPLADTASSQTATDDRRDDDPGVTFRVPLTATTEDLALLKHAVDTFCQSGRLIEIPPGSTLRIVEVRGFV